MTGVLCRLEDLAEGEARGFAPPDGGRAKIIVVRKDDRIHAYFDACPHYGDTPMAWRTNAYLNAAGSRIVCASHGAEFEIETGLCVAGAAVGKSLRRAPAEATANGDIVVSTK